MKKRVPVIRLIVLGSMALGLVALVSGGNLTHQSTASPALLEPSIATHETRADSHELIGLRNPNEISAPIDTVSSVPPTRSSFTATWRSISGAKGYLVDVSTDNAFSNVSRVAMSRRPALLVPAARRHSAAATTPHADKMAFSYLLESNANGA